MLVFYCNLVLSFLLVEVVLKYEICQRYPIPKSLPSGKGLAIALLKILNTCALLRLNQFFLFC